MTEEITSDHKDDINYFKKKLICQIIDGEYEGATVSLRRLKLMEDADITYRLHRNPERNIWYSPLVYNITIFNGEKTRWLHNDNWILARPFCDEYKTREEAEQRIKEGLPEIPEGYGYIEIEQTIPMSEELKKELLMDNGVDLEKKLQNELSKQI